MPSTFIAQLLSERGLPVLFEAGASTAPANYALWANTGTAPAGTAVGSSTPTRVGADLGWTFNGSGNLYWSATNAATYMPTSGGSLICFDWTPSSTSTSEIITWGTAAGTVRRRVVVDSVGFYLTGTAGYSTFNNTLVSGTRYRVVIYTDGTQDNSQCWINEVENTDHSVTGIDDMDATGYDEIRIGSRQTALGNSYGTIHSVFVAHATQAPSQTLIDLFGSNSAADIRTELETYRTALIAASPVELLLRGEATRHVSDLLTDPVGSTYVIGSPVSGLGDEYPTTRDSRTFGYEKYIRRAVTRASAVDNRLSGYASFQPSFASGGEYFRLDLPFSGVWHIGTGFGLVPINSQRSGCDVYIGGTRVGCIGDPSSTSKIAANWYVGGGHVGLLQTGAHVSTSMPATIPGILVDATTSRDLRLYYPTGQTVEVNLGTYIAARQVTSAASSVRRKKRRSVHGVGLGY